MDPEPVSIATRMMRTARRIKETLSAVRRGWQRDNGSVLAAAVAFYAAFSVAPVLVLLLSLATAVMGADAARREVVDVVARFVNPRTALAVQRLLGPPSADDGAVTTTVVSVLLLVAGASAVFRHLRNALNVILDVPPVDAPGWRVAVRGRLIAIVMVVVTLGLLVSSLALTAILASVRRLIPELAAADVAVWRTVDIVVTTAILAGVFGAILKFVPDAKLAWRHVRTPALSAAVTFGIGRYLLGIYMSRTNVTTLYGAAASLFVILVATYFAVLVLFLAAELTEVLARRDREFVTDRLRRQAEKRHPPRKGDAAPEATPEASGAR